MLILGLKHTIGRIAQISVYFHVDLNWIVFGTYGLFVDGGSFIHINPAVNLWTQNVSK